MWALELSCDNGEVVSMNQRTQKWMCDSRSTLPTEKIIDEMQICDTLSPKFLWLIVI